MRKKSDRTGKGAEGSREGGWKSVAGVGRGKGIARGGWNSWKTETRRGGSADSQRRRDKGKERGAARGREKETWTKGREVEKRKGPRVGDKTVEVDRNFRNRQTPRENIEAHKGRWWSLRRERRPDPRLLFPRRNQRIGTRSNTCLIITSL